jgi:adenylate cyclase
MSEQKSGKLAEYEKLLYNEINITLQKGGIVATLLGVLGGMMLWILGEFGIIPYFKIPAVWGSFCGLYGLFIYFMARLQLIRGIYQYVIFLPVIFLPSLIYVISYFVLPSGTATYITGVPSYLYLFVLIMTGFLYNRNFSFFSGAVISIQYFVVYLLGREHLLKIITPDDIMYQDMTSIPFYLIKAGIMLFAGVFIGVFSENAKKLIIKIITEEKEKHQIDKLFGQFVSTEIKDKIISEKKEIIAENKEVVVLFSDIRSFSTYSETTPPEVVVNQLNQYFDRMVLSITQHGGTVDKFIGDAVMAVFDGLIELDDPCSNAVEAAIMMKDELKRLNTKWENEGFHTFRMGIGLSFGGVTQGTLGSHNRKEFTVIGDTVNSAARLEDLTKQYDSVDIIITDLVYDNLNSKLKEVCDYLGTVKVKGKENPIKIYGVKK